MQIPESTVARQPLSISASRGNLDQVISTQQGRLVVFDIKIWLIADNFLLSLDYQVDTL